MRWFVFWLLWMTLIFGLLPDSLPDPLVTLFAGLSLGGGAVIVFYEKIRLEILKEENKSLRQRVKELSTATVYSELSDRKLQRVALNTSKAIRQFLKEQEKTTKTQQQQRKHNVLLVGSPEVSIFKQKFFADALNLRKEMQERLPDYAQEHGLSEIIFEDPHSVTYIEALTVELNRLAYALPIRNRDKRHRRLGN